MHVTLSWIETAITRKRFFGEVPSSPVIPNCINLVKANGKMFHKDWLMDIFIIFSQKMPDTEVNP